VGLDPLAVEAAQKRTEAARERARQKRFGPPVGERVTQKGDCLPPTPPAEANECELEENSAITCEADQHAQILKWANFQGIFVRHSPMDRPQYEGNGMLDFFLMFQGRVCALEMKFGRDKKPTVDQRKCMAALTRAGIPNDVFWTVNEAIAFASGKLLKGKHE
jgi:hypothetical protein